MTVEERPATAERPAAATIAARWIRPRSGIYMALLTGLSSFGPLSTSIYTPVMPLIAAGLHGGADEVKLTLTTYMLGFAVGQIFFGPLSDRFGRRPVLLAGLALFTVMSLACAIVDTVPQMVALRLLQGLSAASGVVISRALARDVYSFNEMPRVMSWISLAVNIAPALAPIIGGHLAVWFGWQAVFYLLAGYGALAFLVVGTGLPETNRQRVTNFSIAQFAGNAAAMLRNRRFLAYVLCIGFAFSVIHGGMAALPFILQGRLGVSPASYGYIVVLSVIGFTMGSFTNNRLVHRVSPERLVRVASYFHLIGLCIMGGLAYAGVLSIWSIILPYMLLSMGTGIITPVVNARAVGLYPQLAGTASSLVGLSQMGLGAFGTFVSAVATDIGGMRGDIPALGAWVGCGSADCGVPMPMVVSLLPLAIALIFSARLLRRERGAPA